MIWQPLFLPFHVSSELVSAPIWMCFTFSSLGIVSQLAFGSADHSLAQADALNLHFPEVCSLLSNKP